MGMEDELLASDPRIDLIRDHIEHIPALSTTVTKVLEVCNRPNTSANDLNRIISMDPVLTGRVLMLINSAYYSIPDHVTSLTRAIIMLGINTVKNLAVSTAVLGAFKGSKSQQILPSDQFWSHSLSVGVTAKALALKKGVSSAECEDCFIGGLLHDLGKMPLIQCFEDDYAKVIGLATENQIPLFQSEQEAFGFHHGWVGKMIAEKWKLGGTITECLHFHHESNNAAEDTQRLVAIVELANIYCNKQEIGTAGDMNPDMSALSKALNVLNFTLEDLDQCKDTVLEEMEKAQVFIKAS